MRFIGRVAISLLLLVGIVEAQTIRWGQIRTGETGVFNVKTSPFNAKGDGVTDDTAAIQAALVAGAGKVVYFPPGSYKVTSTLLPATGTTIEGGGSNAVQLASLSPTSIYYYDTDTPLFKILTDNVRIRDMRLVTGTGVTAIAGGIGIQTQNGIGGGVASALELSGLSIVGFYSGVDIDGSYAATLTNIAVTNSTGPGFVGRASSGYWTNLDAVNNQGHGFYFLATAGTSSGVPPWLSGIQTFNSGGWGIYSEAPITYLDRYYINNDSLGGIYINTSSSISGIIGKGIIQYAGYNTLSTTKSVSAATLATPIEITTSTAHGFTNGQSVACVKGAGNTAMNGTFTITWVSDTKFTLDGSAGTGAYTGSGVCGLASQTYPISPTAPGIKIASTATGVFIDGAVVDASYGNNIDAAGAEFSLRSLDSYSSGVAQVVGSTYSVKSVGLTAKIANVRANTPGYLEGTDSKVTGSNFSSLTAIPALQVAVGERLVIADNTFYNGGGGAALQLDSGVTVERSQNVVIGTLTDNSTASVYAKPIGDSVVFAGLTAQTQKWGICTDCQPTSAVNNTCAAGGTGAFFFLDPAGAWRCVKTTASPAIVTAALTNQNAALTTANLVAAASVAAGTYRASAYIHTTTASAGACTSDVTFGWTYNSASKTKSPISSFNQAIDENFDQASVVFRAAAGAAITYAVARTGVDCSSNVYDVYMILERIQ